MTSHLLCEYRNIFGFIFLKFIIIIFFGTQLQYPQNRYCSANLPSPDVKKTEHNNTQPILLQAPSCSSSRETETQVWGLDQGRSQWQNQIKIHVPRVLSVPLLHLLTHGALTKKYF